MVTLLLSAVSGSLDALAFLSLGQVFASVMTGNLVLLGVAVGTADGAQARSVGIALAGYAVGTAAGSLVARVRRGAAETTTPVLAFEIVPFTAFALIWELAAGAPAAGAQAWALLAAATAMGVQSAAALELPGGPATTYFTGTLTGILADLVREGRLRGWPAARIGSLLLAAVVAGFLVGHAARLAVVVPALGLAAAVATTHRAQREKTSRST